MKKIILISLLLTLLIALVGCQTTTQENSPANSIPKEVINQEFDIPPLLSKSFLEIEQILGTPTNQYDLEDRKFDGVDVQITKTGTAVEYEKENFMLMFDLSLNNEVESTHLCVTSGLRVFNDFLKGGNLQTDSNKYSLKGIKALVDSSKYTCVTIIEK